MFVILLLKNSILDSLHLHSKKMLNSIEERVFESQEHCKQASFKVTDFPLNFSSARMVSWGKGALSIFYYSTKKDNHALLSTGARS